MTTHNLMHLSTADVSVVLGFERDTVTVLHWGASLGHLGDPASFLQAVDDGESWGEVDRPENPGFWREASRGFLGAPTVVGHREGLDWSPRFVIDSVDHRDNRVSVSARDHEAGLAARVEFTLDPSGLLLVEQDLTNIGDSAYALNGLTSWLPLPDRVAEVLDFTGRWVKERQPQRHPIAVGTWAREVREGRSGHDHTITQIAMTPGTSFRQGEAWSVALAWSGNNRYSVERTAFGRTSIGAGELLNPGEVILEPGQTYRAPGITAAYSRAGLDGLSVEYYRWLRGRPEHPTNVRPRPVTLNVWEAVWFDHDLDRLTALMDVAEEIGVERFVLDDGWFHLRRDDYAGLGDWWVDPQVWPQGLGELIRRVKDRGMEFGLWFEPEMVNANSDLFRAHPEWILQVGDRMPPEQRHQQVLNIAHPDAWQYLFDSMNAILDEYDIAYIKWDHNRVLVEPGWAGRAAVREQALAFYRLVDALKQAHPGLEIESCSSGGGRIDLGAAQHCDRFWTSDCNEALERQHIQRWTGIAIPPEMLGTHIGPPRSHSTGREHPLAFRAVTALLGHAGIEWDITTTTQQERDALQSWITFYKQHRELLHSGDVVRVDAVDPAVFVHGVVASDQTQGLFVYAQMEAARASKPANFVLAGLEPAARYRVSMHQPAGEAGVLQSPRPTWADGLVLTGAVLQEIGLRPPRVYPESAFIVMVQRLEEM